MNLNVDLHVLPDNVNDGYYVTGTISDTPADIVTSDMFSGISEVDDNSDTGAIRNALNMIISKIKGK